MPVKALLNLVTGRTPRSHSVPEGQRVYAIGDIHGRLDLLERLLETIREEESRRAPADTRFVFLGDLIDRGPDSRGVVERLIAFNREHPGTRFLMGNHEEVFLRAAEGDAKALRYLVRMGGRPTLLSYGIGKEEYESLGYPELAALFRSKVPVEHVAFLSSFEKWIEIGDYLFVHAGIRPGVAIGEQSPSDLRWIREEFLRHRDDFGKMIVHGHSITADVDERPNRIGIDTGAYASGRLTAIALEGGSRWYLST